MFQFPRFPSVRLCIQRPIRPLARTGVAPFGFDWLIARLQLPSHVSPFSAPFIGLWPHRHPPYTLLRLARLLNLPASFRAQTIRSTVAFNTTYSFASAKSKYITICDCQGACLSSI
jgi:hypothetical protein